MTSRSVLEEALRRVADEAQVDRAAPAGEQVRFAKGSLDRMVHLYRETGGEDAVISAWHRLLGEFIKTGAEAGQGSHTATHCLDRALALLALKDRLRGGAPKQYRMTPAGSLEVVGQADVDPIDDPWLAERNL